MSIRFFCIFVASKKNNMKKFLFFIMLTATLLVVRVNAQAPFTVFSEGFEPPTPETSEWTLIDAGWTLIDANQDGQNWVHSYESYFSGYQSEGAAGSSSQNRTPDNWLISPSITLGSSSTLKFKRMSGHQWPAEHYGVYVSTTSASDIQSFTLLDEETLTENSWQEKTIDLSNYDNYTVYIAFRHFNCSDQFMLIIDDVTVTSTMSDPIITVSPSSLQFNNVPMDTASAGQLVTVNATNITNAISVSVSTPFEISTDNIYYTLGVTLADTSHNLYVRYIPNSVGIDSGVVSLTSGTASAEVILHGNCIACPPPTPLSASAVTSSSAIVNWSGSANSYNIYYQAESDTDWQTIEYVSDTTSYFIGNLTPATTYNWYVAAICSDGSLINSTGMSTFTTGCTAFPVPFEQDFDSSTSMPQCWNRYNGWASNVFNGEILTSTTGDWYFFNQLVFGSYHARLNICNTNCNKWLVTPNIDLSGLINPTLTFDLALTASNNASAITPGNQPDDKFMVLVSTDEGITWSSSNAKVWSNDGNGNYVFDQIPAAGQEISISLIDFANQTVRIAFYGESTVQNGDNDLHIDNVSVIDNSHCAYPSNLTATTVTNNSVTLSWTENGSATSWNVEYGPAGFQHGTGIMAQADSNSLTINNLSLAAYDFYVRADCDDEQSFWVGPTTATPGSYTMGTIGFDTITTCSSIIYDNGGVGENYTGGCHSVLVIFPEISGNSIAVSGNYHTENCCDYLHIYDGTSISGTLLGEYKGTGTIPTLVSSTGPITLLFHSDNSTQYDGFELNVSCVSCLPPSNLTASNISSTSADLSWTGSSLSYRVEYKADNDSVWTSQTVNDTVFGLTDLTTSMLYAVRIYSNCENEDSPAATLSFYTTMVPVDIPYSTDFNSTTDWILNNGTCDNYWTIEAVSDSTSALFITNNGTIPGYSTSTFSAVSAEKLFTVGTATEIVVSFDVQAGGEDEFDYLKVFLAPADMQYFASTTNTYYTDVEYDTYAVDFSEYMPYSAYGLMPYKYNLTNGNTIHVSVTMPNPNSIVNANSTAKLVFLWKNDNNGGVQPGAIISNVSIHEITCPAPTVPIVSNITSTSADITWYINGNEEHWTLEYKEEGESDWNPVSVSITPTYNLTGLNEMTTYHVRVQALCDDNEQSSWVETVFSTENTPFTTEPSVSTENASSIALLPNPADNHIELRINSNVEVKEAVVYNAFGQLIQTVQLIENHARIDLSNMASGMYFVRVNGEGVSATKKFIKR